MVLSTLKLFFDVTEMLNNYKQTNAYGAFTPGTTRGKGTGRFKRAITI